MRHAGRVGIETAQDCGDASLRHVESTSEQRRRCVDGPVLVVPRAASGSINNLGTIVIPGVGTIFPAMANKGVWGGCNATARAMISADGETITLPGPVVVDRPTLRAAGRRPLGRAGCT